MEVEAVGSSGGADYGSGSDGGHDDDESGVGVAVFVEELYQCTSVLTDKDKKFS